MKPNNTSLLNQTVSLSKLNKPLVKANLALLIGAVLCSSLAANYAYGQTEANGQRQQFSISELPQKPQIQPETTANIAANTEPSSAANIENQSQVPIEHKVPIQAQVKAQSDMVAELKNLHQSAVLYRLWGQDKAQKSAPQSAAASLPSPLKLPKTLDQASVSKTREQKMAEKVSAAPLNQASQYYGFTVYDAKSRLLEDFDGDSFYSTFSVTFDADVNGLAINEYANVYAELYISEEGGPWLHYYTTDVFTLEGNSSFDDYKVLTTLHSGYQSAHYDVLIDLYEVGFSDVVATISSDDSNALYALPLESSDRDRAYVDPYPDTYIEVEAGGAMSWWSVIGLFGLGLINRVRKLKVVGKM
jgi:hypothetical protein